MSDIVSDIRNLAIPFSFMLVMNGVKYISGKNKAKTQSKAKTTKTTKGGCGCGKTGVTLGGARNEALEELDMLSDNLQQVFNTTYRNKQS